MGLALGGVFGDTDWTSWARLLGSAGPQTPTQHLVVLRVLSPGRSLFLLPPCCLLGLHC